MYNIRLANSNDYALWDGYVRSHAQAGPYHLFAWGEAVNAAYHHRPYYLLCENEGDELEGVLPLVLFKPPLLKGTLLSLPFCDYGGVLANKTDVADALYKHAFDMAEKLNCGLELRCAQSQPSLQEGFSLGVTTHKVRMLLDLPQGSQILWDSFKSKLRSQIKRPQKDGLIFKLGSQELLDDFYYVFRVNMRDLGSPVHARTWIASVLEQFGSNAHVGVVYTAQQPVAAGIVLDCGNTVSIPWASALFSHSKSSPNMLLYWGFLQYACDNGFKRFDFGRSTPGEGTYNFKEQWGCVPEPLYWYGTGFTDNQNVGDSTGKPREIVEKVWSKLPQVFADKIGPCVRRYISL